MLDPHVRELSAAADARDGAQLAAAIRRAFPGEPAAILRRAVYYAVTDPDRRDGALIGKHYDAAFALQGVGGAEAIASIRDREPWP